MRYNKIFGILILLLCFSLFNCEKHQQEQDLFDEYQRNNFSLSQSLYKVRQYEKQYQNIFTKYNDLIVQTKIVQIFPPVTKGAKPKVNVLKQRNTSIVLEQEFLKMYKNKFAFKMPLEITKQLLDNKENNVTYIQNTFYISYKGNYYKLETQFLPLFYKFKRHSRESYELFLLADTQLLKKQQPWKGIVNKVDIYLFELQQKLIFNKTVKNGQIQEDYFRMYSQPYSKDVNYYYPRPLSQKINLLKSNYYSVSSLQEGSTYWVNFDIKIASGFFPTMYYYMKRMLGGTQMLDKQFQKYDAHSVEQLKQASFQPIVKFLKKFVLQQSFFVKTFLMTLLILIVSTPLIWFLSFLFEVQYYKNAYQFRGISKYSLNVLFYGNIIGLIVPALILPASSIISSGLWTFIFTMWKRKNFGNWYRNYQQIDRRAFNKLCIYLLPFMLLCLLYPFIFQGYSTQHANQLFLKQDPQYYQQYENFPLGYYLIARIIGMIGEYKIVLFFLPQIMLNYQLKSGNGTSWKVLIASILIYFSEFTLTFAADNWIQTIFYLKQEICVMILIYQKFYYGNNLDQLNFPKDDHFHGNNGGVRKQNTGSAEQRVRVPQEGQEIRQKYSHQQRNQGSNDNKTQDKLEDTEERQERVFLNQEKKQNQAKQDLDRNGNQSYENQEQKRQQNANQSKEKAQ